MVQIKSVFIADEIEPECLDILQKGGIKAVKRTKLSEEELCKELSNYDAVIVRSATKMTRKVIEATNGKLKLIGRAGTGVDNIDVGAATECGILVMNTPAGNSRSAAELTCSLMLSLSRRITEADRSMKDNKWDRKALMGEEVFGKTLAIIGLGHIGMEVAKRMQAFGMNVVGYDPFVTAEKAAKVGVQWMRLNDIWPIADYITVHVPLTPDTNNLIDHKTLKVCKKGVKIINVARGGVVNEQDLLEMLNNGYVAGAALDVYQQEPPTDDDIINHPKVICTPHLGASTIEAQRQVAEEIAENIVALNAGRKCFGILNATIDTSVNKQLESWADAVRVLTKIASALAPSDEHKILVTYPADNEGPKEVLKKALWTAAAIAHLNYMGFENVNLVNALLCATINKLQVAVQEGHTEMIDVSVDDINVCGYKSAQGIFICGVGGSKVPIPLVANGILAINLTDNQRQDNLLETLKPNLCIECGLIGGGRIACFSQLNDQQIEMLSDNKYSIVKFD